MIEEQQIVPYRVSPLPPGPWLVLAPHADDESFGLGGSLLRARQEGISADLVVMTDGALGGAQADIAAVRRAEARAAAGLLGMRRLVFLDQADRGLRPDQALVDRLVEEIRASAPGTVFFPGVMELHPDHRMTAELAWRALRRLGNPDVMPAAYEISVQSPVNRLMDITAWMREKRRVLACYESQLGQNNYGDIVEALNRSRTFTLPDDVRYAEGIWLYNAGDTAHSLRRLALDRLGELFAAD